MNEFDSLKSLRNDVPERSVEELAPSYTALNRAMLAEERALARAAGASAGSDSRRSWFRSRLTTKLAGWSAAAAVAVTLGVVAAQVLTPTAPAVAAEILREAADNTIKYSDLEVGEGQYLRVASEEYFPHGFPADTPPAGFEETYQSPYSTTSFMYIPADRDESWVWDRSGIVIDGKQFSEGEFLVAKRGLFYEDTSDGIAGDGTVKYEGNLTLDRLQELPTSSGKAAYEYVDSFYDGGSVSRAEDNLGRILGFLRVGTATAEQRVALYEAIALVPDVTSSPEVTLSDGRTAVGFSRTEANRQDQRTEILIDPSTGQFVGERTLSADGTADWEALFTYSVVDEAPTSKE